jgi:hypothetical protein
MPLLAQGYVIVHELLTRAAGLRLDNGANVADCSEAAAT